MRWRLRAWLALVFWAGGGLAATRPVEKPKGAHVRILTFNINYAMPAPDETLAAIREAKADIVLLQEVNTAWERYLRPRLRRTYRHVQFRITGRAGGAAVLSTGGVKEIAWVRPEAGWFPAWVLRVETAIGPVQILSVHLRPPANDRGRYTIASFLAAGAIHLKEIQELSRQLKLKLPTIIVGDFNENDGGAALTWLHRQGYVNALPEFDLKTPTWHWPTETLTLYGRLDHILYSRPLHALEARVIRKGGSDHYPVLAVLEARRPKKAPPDGD